MTRKKPRGALSDDDSRVWKKITEGITKIDNNRAPTPLVRKAIFLRPPSDSQNFNPAMDQKKVKAPPSSLFEQSFILRDADPNWQQKLRRGKVKPEGKIDLHGLTQDRAYAVLSRYIEEAQRRGRRSILVITGKGGTKSGYGEMSASGYGRGILRTNVPRWLSQGALAARVVSYYEANMEHGGDGALYVVLKKAGDQKK